MIPKADVTAAVKQQLSAGVEGEIYVDMVIHKRVKVESEKEFSELIFSLKGDKIVQCNVDVRKPAQVEEGVIVFE